MNKLPISNNYIYEFELNQDLVDVSLEKILSKNIKYNSTVPNAAKWGYFTDTGIDEIPIYEKDLFDEIQKCVDLVCDLHFTDSKLVICDSWLTKVNFGQGTNLHYHSFSIFSGLLYFGNCNTSKTTFEIEDTFYKRYEILFEPKLKKQKVKLDYAPQKGKLLIWDSTILHKISTHKERDIRYSLAFNTWLSGQISDFATARLKSDAADIGSQFNSTYRTKNI